MNELFELATDLPEAPSALPVPILGPPREARSVDLTARAEALIKTRMRQLRVRGRPVDRGDRLELLTPEHSLEVYLMSDSVWYANRPLAFGTEARAKLPGVRAAKAFADACLERLELVSPHLRYTGFHKTEVSTSSGPKAKPRTRASRVDVTYGFAIEGVPVRGPGAKVLVGLTAPDELAELVWFWRNVELAAPRPIQDARWALDIFMRQARFRGLKAGHSRITVTGVELGYYALGPRSLQRMLAPRYTVKGTERSGDLATGFTAHVMAARFRRSTVKAEQTVDGAIPRMIVGE